MIEVIEEDTPTMVKINESANIHAQESLLKPKKAAEKTENNSNKPITDNVVISEDSRLLETLQASFAQEPEVNQTLVERFKAEIARGEYEPNSENIANILLNKKKV